MSTLTLIPLALAVLCFLGTIWGRSAHDRTYYQWFSEYFLLLVAIYAAPLGLARIYVTLGLLPGALAVIYLLRWAVSDKRLLPTGQLLRKRYPGLYSLFTGILSLPFILLTPHFLSEQLYRILAIGLPILSLLIIQVALVVIHHRGLDKA